MAGGAAKESRKNPRNGKAPAYQWYPGDALADEAMTMMTLEEEGAFRRLLDHHYREHSIPADAEELRRLCKWITPSRFRKIWERIGKCFVPKPGDPSRLVNSRAEEQRRALDDFAENASAGGIQAAANMTAEQRSERASKAAKTKHGAANEKAESKQPPANAVLSPANTASSTASASSEDPEEIDSAGARAGGVQPPSTPLPPPPVTPGLALFVALVARADRCGLMPDRAVGQLLQEKATAEARAAGADPVKYAESVCDAFEVYRLSLEPSMRPDWSDAALRKHWPRLTRIVAGKEAMPSEWSAPAASRRTRGDTSVTASDPRF